MAEGIHLFPFRTEKLSPPAPMVLPGRPGGRVGRRPLNHPMAPWTLSAGPFGFGGPPGARRPAGRTRGSTFEFRSWALEPEMSRNLLHRIAFAKHPPRLGIPWRMPPEGSSEITTSIGGRYKVRKDFSRPVLISRAA